MRCKGQFVCFVQFVLLNGTVPFVPLGLDSGMGLALASGGMI